MRPINRAEGFVTSLESGFLVVIVLVMILLSFLQVVLRIFFHEGFLWADPFLRHMVLWAGFLGAALASVERKHFGWETATKGPGKIRIALRLASGLATVAIAAFLVWFSWNYLQDEKTAGDILFSAGGVNFPVWTFACAIPGGFGLILFHTLLSCLREGAELFQS